FDSYTTVYTMMIAGTFPRSRQVGSKVGWFADEIAEYQANLPLVKLKEARPKEAKFQEEKAANRTDIAKKAAAASRLSPRHVSKRQKKLTRIKNWRGGKGAPISSATIPRAEIQRRKKKRCSRQRAKPSLP